MARLILKEVDEIDVIKLLDAINLFKRATGSSSRAYGWYRNSALREGLVEFGEMEVSVKKIKGAWFVKCKDLDRAIDKFHAASRRQTKITKDLRKGIVFGKDGDTIDTDWGSYTIHKPFRLETSDYESLRRKSDGAWICNKCNKSAQTEHNNEDCHRCSDGYGCGNDCTLSKVFCSNCNHSISF